MKCFSSRILAASACGVLVASLLTIPTQTFANSSADFEKSDKKNVLALLFNPETWVRPLKKEEKKQSKKAAPRKANYSKDTYKKLIAKYAREHKVPLKLAQAVVQVESNFNAKARGAAGEIGLMQIKPATARFIGFRGKTSALYNPEVNIRWGMTYLGKAHKLAGGNLCGTILRYNAGHAAKRMNPISAKYCGRVKTIMAKL